MDNIMTLWENRNQDKQGKHCNEQRKPFSPFVLYVDGILGNEALFVFTSLSQLMASKIDKPISHVCA